ncbi:hypothetical protein FSP39_011870 [Pinctada imbricata]|uniref:Sodium/calcium exchanger membrane region domain-containing protein n=1 Tax=Pinctada imbricata TaxID=66713 RepID=A0AA88Y073_PINIB|nr:hypothetical protein FSP39_011870 [Pinctada imbricata]
MTGPVQTSLEKTGPDHLSSLNVSRTPRVITYISSLQPAEHRSGDSSHLEIMWIRRKRSIQAGLFVAFVVTFTLLQKFGTVEEITLDDKWLSKGSSRQLTSLPNCTPRAVQQFPADIFDQKQRSHGAIITHIFAAVYMFAGFAYLCDDYFVPSLEIISEVFHIQSDVAGATLMAAGSSAPELATAIIAVFIAKDDIGLGAVVGSAVYNVMFVISICALFAGMVVHLHWWPLVRDCVFYALSVAALAFVILDEKVYWYEALGLVILYIVYIVMMYFNSKLESWMTKKFTRCCNLHRTRPVESETIVLYDKLKETTTTTNGSIAQSQDAKQREENGNADPWDRFPVASPDSDYDSDENYEVANSTHKTIAYREPEEPDSVFAVPESCCMKIVWFVCLPIKFLLYITIPDCRYKRWRKWFIVTFIMSLVWLCLFSYVMVWMITIIGYTLNIPDTIMALTFVAFGVSLPDVISSLIVVREGLGDMAVSNAVGSNVFDILICLGVPWLLQSTIRQSGKPVQVYSEGLLYSSLTLLLTVVFLVAATHINKWRLTKKYGVVLMFVYVLFTILTSLYELNLFGYVHPKECQIKY